MDNNERQGKSSMQINLRIGQTLLFVREDRFCYSFVRGRNETIDQAIPLTIEKLGRKWASCGGYRVDRQSLIVSGESYSSPGRCYLSREHYAAVKAADAAWLSLYRAIQYKNRPFSLTIEEIREAAALLGIEIPRGTGNGDA